MKLKFNRKKSQKVECLQLTSEKPKEMKEDMSADNEFISREHHWKESKVTRVDHLVPRMIDRVHR